MQVCIRITAYSIVDILTYYCWTIAIRNSGFKAPFTMTEEIWNVEDPEILKKEGKDAPGGGKYFL